MTNCKFCNIREDIQYDVKNAFAISDKYPVTKYHTLVIPKRHVESYFDLTVEEHLNCIILLDVVRNTLVKLDNTITGFNIGVNNGKDAGQTISHCHIHLIPRRKNDTENPKGGIRRVISKKEDWQKGNYSPA